MEDVFNLANLFNDYSIFERINACFSRFFFKKKKERDKLKKPENLYEVCHFLFNLYDL
jgi:hypothetical protein